MDLSPILDPLLGLIPNLSPYAGYIILTLLMLAAVVGVFSFIVNVLYTTDWEDEAGQSSTNDPPNRSHT